MIRTEALLQFRILGPLELVAGTRQVELGGARQQIILATLLLHANQVVSTGRLLKATYGEAPPPTARSQAQISISALRRLLAGHSGGAMIHTRPQGYLLHVEDGRLDAQRFEELTASARRARDAGQRERTVAHYRDALRLWRGAALEGLDSLLVQVAASRLDELRLAANEDRIKLELELGRHRELVSELTELIEEFPLRERLRGDLMLALYRCDRAAEALQVYRKTRQIMIDELGIEPGERLQQLEYAVLTADPDLDLPSAPVTAQAMADRTPCLLPTDIADFTGRAAELAQIRDHLTAGAKQQTPHAVPVAVIVGKGGIGKTSIAVHASHLIADQFSDGQLYADLHGGTSRSATTEHVLERFLRCLGVPGAQIPDGLDERAEIYRALLAGRKILVVLDDALTERDVAPLLPGHGAATVIITSRARLGGLAGAAHIEVDVLDADESVRLLARIAGAERVQAELTATTEITDLCGRLPLALRIAGARLAARPHWDIQHLLDRLSDESRRLDELRHGDMGIRANISLSYETASKPARRLFQLLGLLDLPGVSGWVAAALIDGPVSQAEDLLDELVNAQLIETTGIGPLMRNQYRFHELIRVFSRERLAAEQSVGERKAALERALSALLTVAEEAHCRHYGGDYFRLRSEAPRWPLPDRLIRQLTADPLAWYEHERAAIVCGIRQAAQAGFVELCWSLALSAVTLFESRVYFDDWRQTHQIALDATRRAQDARGQAAMLYSMGTLHMTQQRFDAARQHFSSAAGLFRDTGDDQGTALVSRQMAYLDRLNGHLGDASRRYEQSLAIFRRTGDSMATAYVQHSLAQVKLELGQVGEAQALLTEALKLSQAARSGRVEAQVLHRIGEAYLLMGDLSRAVETFDRALARVRSLGDPIGEAYVLQSVGVAKARQGEFHQADSLLRCALALADRSGERLVAARAVLGLSELAFSSGDPQRAILLAQQAASTFEEMNAPLLRARALDQLSAGYGALGETGAARQALAEAATLRVRLPASLQRRRVPRQLRRVDEAGRRGRRRSPAGWNPPAPRSPARTTEPLQAQLARRRCTYAAGPTVSPSGVASARPLCSGCSTTFRILALVRR